MSNNNNNKNATSLISPVQPQHQGPLHHAFVGANALIFICLVGLCMFISFQLKRCKLKIPDSTVSLIIGTIVGISIYFFTEHRKFTHLHEEEYAMFQPDLFYFVLLPPIIFEAGFNLHNPRFFKNIGTIVLYAVVGTCISIAVIAYGLYQLALKDLIPINKNDPLESLLFASLISAIDPVGTITVLANKDLNANKLMTTLIFGESVLNDAVAIVLFNTVRRMIRSHTVDYSIFLIGQEFVITSIISIFIGIILALIASFFLHTSTELHEYPEYEFIIILSFSYASYCVAEIVGYSGVMSLFVCGVVMSHYAWYNVSRIVKISTKNAFASFAQISETFVYCYLGITCVLTTKPDFHMKWSWSLTGYTFLLCLIGRAFNIFSLTYLANKKREQKISFRIQLMLWFAGLRGAIAFALALNVPTKYRAEIITTTMSIVMITTLLQGSLTEPIVKLLNLNEKENENNQYTLLRHRGQKHVRKWFDFDATYLKPFFGGNPHPPDLDLAKQEADVFNDVYLSSNDGETDDEFMNKYIVGGNPTHEHFGL